MEWLLLGAGLLLILGTGFFVAVEFSLVALDQATVQRAVDNGDTAAAPLLKCLKSLSTQLSSCQLGITMTTLLTGYVMEPSVGKLLEGPLAALGLPEAAASSVSLVLAMAFATLLSMLIGELVPKNMAIALSFQVGKALARPQLVFTAIFKPAIVVLNGFSNKVLNVFGLEAKEEISGARTPAELASLVRRSAAMGTLDAGTANFIARTLKFSGRTAADVMTPRIRVETIDGDQPVSDIVEAARRTGYSRFPVIGESSDDIRGVVHIKKAIAVPSDRRAKLEAGAIMTDVLRVPETIHLDALLAELREGNLQLAVVLDEYGGTAGIATLEDLVEEIVGEVADEHDKVRPGLLQSASGDWYFPGLLRPDELSEQIPGLTVPDESAYETVGGYVMSQLGRIAAVGDTVDVGGGTLSVTRMDGRRIDRICFKPVRGAPGEDALRRPGRCRMSDWAGILWLVVLLLGNAFFVAAEFAVMSARRSQIEPLAEAGSKRAQTTLRAMENVSLMLACAQLGITVCSLLILQVAEPAIHHLMAVPLEAVGMPMEIADIVAFAVALLAGHVPARHLRRDGPEEHLGLRGGQGGPAAGAAADVHRPAGEAGDRGPQLVREPHPEADADRAEGRGHLLLHARGSPVDRAGIHPPRAGGRRRRADHRCAGVLGAHRVPA